MKLEITKQEFEAYEAVRVSGITNMFDVTVVQKWSGLSREKIIAIMKNYSELMKKYPEVRKGTTSDEHDTTNNIPKQVEDQRDYGSEKGELE